METGNYFLQAILPLSSQHSSPFLQDDVKQLMQGHIVLLTQKSHFCSVRFTSYSPSFLQEGDFPQHPKPHCLFSGSFRGCEHEDSYGLPLCSTPATHDLSLCPGSTIRVDIDVTKLPTPAAVSQKCQCNLRRGPP